MTRQGFKTFVEGWAEIGSSQSHEETANQVGEHDPELGKLFHELAAIRRRITAHCRVRTDFGKPKR